MNRLPLSPTNEKLSGIGEFIFEGALQLAFGIAGFVLEGLFS